jgi:hydrogenase maturation protease
VTQAEPPRILVAGLGNIFLGDDAFGVEVARRLAETALPGTVRVLDVGIRSVHLAYELADGGYDTVILIDLVSKGGEPGTLYVLEPDDDDIRAPATLAPPDGHAIQPAQVLALMRRLGGRPCRVLIVGCEPSRVDEVAGLSPVVEAAVERALPLVVSLIGSRTVARAVAAGS